MALIGQHGGPPAVASRAAAFPLTPRVLLPADTPSLAAGPFVRPATSGTRQLTVPSTLLEGCAVHMAAKPSGAGPRARIRPRSPVTPLPNP